jgi:hypothetical protein
LIVSLGFAFLLGELLFSGDSATRARQEIEARIASWRAGSDDEIQPTPSLRRPEMEIVGDWEIRLRLAYSYVSIHATAGENYAVHFETGGCMGGYQGDRTATYHAGVLKLDKPVSEYLGGSTFDTMYAVNVDDREVLLPAAKIRQLEADSFSNGAQSNPSNAKTARSRTASIDSAPNDATFTT